VVKNSRLESFFEAVTAIIGKAIRKPDLEYVKLPDEQLRPVLLQLRKYGRRPSGNVGSTELWLHAVAGKGVTREHNPNFL